MFDETLRQFRDELASASPTPGGGSAAAVTASLGTALLLMALDISAKKDERVELTELRDPLRSLLSQFERDAERDRAAYQSYVIARDMSKTNDNDTTLREEAIQNALRESAGAPIATMEHVLAALEISKRLAPLARPAILSDVKAGEAILRGAFGAANATLEANLPYFKDEKTREEYAKKSVELGAKLMELSKS